MIDEIRPGAKTMSELHTKLRAAPQPARVETQPRNEGGLLTEGEYTGAAKHRLTIVNLPDGDW